jgi:hypothetical protein
MTGINVVHGKISPSISMMRTITSDDVKPRRHKNARKSYLMKIAGWWSGKFFQRGKSGKVEVGRFDEGGGGGLHEGGLVALQEGLVVPHHSGKLLLVHPGKGILLALQITLMFCNFVEYLVMDKLTFHGS